jgi:hypothetical protein
MSFSRKILPALAVAIALAPLAAQAQSADVARQALAASVVTPSSATIDNPTTIYGGVGVNAFHDSFGG